MRLVVLIMSVASVFSHSVLAQNAAHPLPIGYGFPEGKAIDLASLSLGSSGVNVRTVLDAHFQKLSLRPTYEMLTSPSSSQPFLFRSWVPRNVSMPDFISTIFSAPPSGNQLLYIHRELSFVENQPGLQATSDALEAKFGKPSYRMDIGKPGFAYYYKGGRLLTEADGKDHTACRFATQAINQISGAGDPNSAINHLMNRYNTMMRDGGACDIGVLVSWELDVKNPKVLRFLNVSQLDFARFRVTYEVDAAADKAAEQRRLDSLPKGGALPKL